MTAAHKEIYDLAIVGAGLQGASVALEAVNRGLRCVLIHAGVIGGSAAARQSVLVGGGYEQLTQFNFDAFFCNTRELTQILERAPHLTKPLPAYFFHDDGLRTRLKIKLGTEAYRSLWRDGSACIANSENLEDGFRRNFNRPPAYQKPLPTFVLNYARIGIATLRALQDSMCDRLLAHRLAEAERHEDHWRLTIVNANNEKRTIKRAKIVVNCTGTKADDMIRDTFEVSTRGAISKAVIGQVFLKCAQPWQSAAIISDEEGALLSLHPVSPTHTCLACLNAEDSSDQAKKREIDRALSVLNTYATQALSYNDIVHTQWSEQTLVEDPVDGHPSEDLLLDLNNPGRAAPLLNLFGSRPCQHRKIAQQSLDVLEDFYPRGNRRQLKTVTLPGNDFGESTLSDFIQALCRRYAFLDPATVERLVAQFGSCSQDLLNGVTSPADMGKDFGFGLYEREVRYLYENEWAKSTDDILWRRTLLGLHFDEKKTKVLAEYLHHLAA